MRPRIVFATAALMFLCACSSHEDHVNQAKALLKAGKTDEALTLLNAVIKKFPPYPKDAKYAEAFHQRGLAHSRGGGANTHAARQDFDTCARLDPDHLECVFESGKRGYSSEMLKSMNKVIQLDPKRWLAYKLRATGAVGAKSFQGVEDDLKIWLANRPKQDAKNLRRDNLEIYRLRAAVAAHRGDFVGAYELRRTVGPGLDQTDDDGTWTWILHGLKESARAGNGRAGAALRVLGLSKASFLDEARASFKRGNFQTAALQAGIHLSASKWTGADDKQESALVRAYEAAAKIAEGKRIKPLATGKDFRRESKKQKALYDQAIRKAKRSLERAKTPLGFILRGEANCRRGYYTAGFKDVDAALALKPGAADAARVRTLCADFKRADVSSSGSSSSSSSSAADKYRKLRKKIKKRRKRY